MAEENSFYVGNVSTFPPRKCGIGSFAKDMIESFSGDKRVTDWESIPIVWEKGKVEYLPRHRNHIRKEILQSSSKSFKDIARYIINTAEYLRSYNTESGWFFNHEYGICAEDHHKDYAVGLLKILKENNVPNIIIGHTVLSNPDEHKRGVMKEIIENTDKFICLTPSAINILTEKYNAPREKLVYIAHGVPEFYIGESREEIKRSLGWIDKNGNPRPIFASLGYLSHNKGLEYPIQGFAGVIKSFPKALFAIIGGTHPDILRAEGEEYRGSLEQLVKDLKIPGAIINDKEEIKDMYGNSLNDLTGINLVFISRHLSDEEFPRFMKGSDFGVIGNLSEDQISSGPGTWWIGNSRITIATASPFFKDMENQGIGLLVPFKDTGAFEDRMIYCLNLSKRGKDELEFVASDFGSTNPWTNVGNRYLNLMGKIILHKKGLRDGT